MKPLSLVFLAFLAAGCVPSTAEIADDFKRNTGLQQPESGSPYLTKNHRGYPVLFRPQMGDVWGRYAARLGAAEVGRELGSVGAFLTGSTRSGVGGVTGSPFDRMLSQAIGQPLTFFVVLKHGKSNGPRLDVLSDFSTVRPEDTLPEQGRIGFAAGSIYSNDAMYAYRILGDDALTDRLAAFRSQYIRVDELGASFVFSGSETDWSAMIREHGGYAKLVNDIMDALADLADKIDGPRGQDE